jgi:hypothetical protein
MFHRLYVTLLSLVLFYGCSDSMQSGSAPLQHRATGASPEVIATYEAWFGHPDHISIGYSSHDPDVIKRQIHQAQAMGISAFVVDWYGDREPFIDQSYALIQKLAEKNKFHVAMMYDETNDDAGATDEAFADFTEFHNAYLSSKSPGHNAYLTYEGRPVIFIFPKGGHTDWSKVRALVSTWNPAPLLIYENLPGPDAAAFDGFYAWIGPGDKGWLPDGSNWGEEYLKQFYQTMQAKYSDKIIVGGAWAAFDDKKASWGLNRHVAARCGQTFNDTFNYWRSVFPAGDPIPFVMVETWNDYEEGTAIERGIPGCGDPTCGDSRPTALPGLCAANSLAQQKQPSARPDNPAE